MGFGSYDIIPENKTYIIWTRRYLSSHEYVDYNDTVISKINDRICKMKSNGYTFFKKINEENLKE